MMNILLSAAVAMLAHSTAPRGIPATASECVITNVNVVTMTSEDVLRDQWVFVHDGKIVAIEAAPEASPGEGFEVIDGGGGFLLPGLADMHAHVRWDPENTFLLFLASGVTTVRNMDSGDGWFDHVALREAVERGVLIGPRYLVSGPVLNPQSVPSLETVEPVLDWHVDRGFDYVKIHADMRAEVYDALIEGAGVRDLKVVGHAQRSRELEQTLRLYSVAHAEEFHYLLGDEGLADSERRRALAREVARSGTWVCPTLAVYRRIADYLDDDRFATLVEDPRLAYLPRAERALWLSDDNEYRQRSWPIDSSGRFLEIADLLGALVKDLHDAGVPLILGTDAFGAVVPGFSVVDELELLVEAGLSPFEALQTGTANVARYLGESDTSGTIEVGKRADFVLLGANPLEDVGAVADVRGLYYRGRWTDRARIRVFLERIRGHYGG